MKKAKRTLLIVLSVLMIYISSFTVVFAQEEVKSGDNAVDYINQLVYIIKAKYRFDVDDATLYKAALDYVIRENPDLLSETFKGMFDALDQHSVYYTDEELQSFTDSISGEFCGIGVLISTTEDGLLVSNVYDNSPAKECGLLPGDIITKYEDISLAGVDVSIAQGYILGEEGTAVNLTVCRNGESFEINTIRKHVVVDSGLYQSIENDTIGYIRINGFDEHVSDFVEKALDEFDVKEIKNIIVDLRNNPGGSLTELVNVCSLFIPEGPAIHLSYKNPLRDVTLYSDNDKVKYNVEVLINENSASASEAFSGAIQDTGVGIVIGQQSYGKGTMQSVTKFKIGGGIKMTEAVYLTPNKRSINGKGVTPDLKITDKITSYFKSDFEKMSYNRDIQENDTGKDVLALEQRLNYLGLLDELPDENYNAKTANAIHIFQQKTGIAQSGSADINTQTKIESCLQGEKIVNDTTLKTAITLFKNNEWEDYKHDWSVK